MTDRHEWQRDAAVWLTGRRIEAGLPADPASMPSPRLARAMAAFQEWQAAAQLEADAARFAGRVRDRVAGLGQGVRRIDRPPEAVRSRAPGPLAPMVLAARRVHAAPLADVGVAAGSGRELLDEPCDTWVALPADLPSSRYVALRVVGDSMLPLLHSGDVVLLDLDAAVRPGMIAVARHPEHGYVVKRVARAGGRGSGCRWSRSTPPIPRWRSIRAPGRCWARWCCGGARMRRRNRGLPLVRSQGIIRPRAAALESSIGAHMARLVPRIPRSARGLFRRPIHPLDLGGTRGHARHRRGVGREGHDAADARGLRAGREPRHPDPSRHARTQVLAAVGRLQARGRAQSGLQAAHRQEHRHLLQPLARHAQDGLRPAPAEHLRPEVAP